MSREQRRQPRWKGRASQRLASAASATLVAIVLLSLASMAFNARAQPDCLINGHVLDAQNSQPIQGASITFTNQQNSTASSLNADGSGYYSTSLPYATYSAHVEEPGYDPVDMDVTLNQPSMIQDFRLQPAGGGNCQVDGYVYNAQNNLSISNAHIVLTDQHTNMTNDAYTDGSGHYNMNLPYGMYNAHIEAQGYNPSDMAVSLGQPSFTQDFVLSPNGNGGGNKCQLEGYVRGPSPSSSTSSGSGTSVSNPADMPISGVHIVFTRTNSNMTSDTYTDGNGHYSIILQYGSYTVNMDKPGYQFGGGAVDANQPSVTRDFELQSNGSGGNGGGNGNGNSGSGSSNGNPSEGISSTMSTLGTMTVAVFSIALACAIIITIIIGVVVFLVRYFRG